MDTHPVNTDKIYGRHPLKQNSLFHTAEMCGQLAKVQILMLYGSLPVLVIHLVKLINKADALIS